MISFIDSEKLHITKQSLINNGAKVQCFAIYIPENVHPDMRFSAALQMVDLFYEKILVETRNEIDSLTW